MGGRLDATNVIPRPDCAVVTNIGLDHTAVLGDTVEQIAAEKAGIFKGGRGGGLRRAALRRRRAEAGRGADGDAAGICGFFKAGAGVGQPGGPALPLRGPGVRHPPAGRAPDEKRRDGYLCRAGAGPVGGGDLARPGVGGVAGALRARVARAGLRPRRGPQPPVRGDDGGGAGAIFPRAAAGCCCWACLRTRTGGGCWTSCCPWRRRRCA